MAADLVVQAVEERLEPREVLQRTSEALARAAAVLEHQREILELRGRDVGQLVSRRATILMSLTKLQIQRREFDPLDVRSQQMLRLFKAWFETVSATALEVLLPEQYNVFVTRLEADFEGWEDEVEARLR